jgi:acyl carrier protein
MSDHEAQDTMGVIGEFLKSSLPQIRATEIDAQTGLISNGLDSLSILELATFLSSRFGVEIDDLDFDPANFETVGTLVAMVERKRAA